MFTIDNDDVLKIYSLEDIKHRPYLNKQKQKNRTNKMNY